MLKNKPQFSRQRIRVRTFESAEETSITCITAWIKRKDGMLGKKLRHTNQMFLNWKLEMCERMAGEENKPREVDWGVVMKSCG